MKKLLSLLVAVVILPLILAGCDDDSKEPVGPNNGQSGSQEREVSSRLSLTGTTWKLYGVVDVATGLMAPPPAPIPVPEDNSGRSYSLEFREDSTFSTFSSVNEYGGTYYVEEFSDNEVIYKIHIENFWGTKVGAVEPWGGDDRWWMNSFKTIKNFTLQENELKLFYNDGMNCLIFKPL
jgi:hypothetical protein